MYTDFITKYSNHAAISTIYWCYSLVLSCLSKVLRLLHIDAIFCQCWSEIFHSKGQTFILIKENKILNKPFIIICYVIYVYLSLAQTYTHTHTHKWENDMKDAITSWHNLNFYLALFLWTLSQSSHLTVLQSIVGNVRYELLGGEWNETNSVRKRLQQQQLAWGWRTRDGVIWPTMSFTVC